MTNEEDEIAQEQNYPNIKQAIGLSLYFILFSLIVGFILGIVTMSFGIKAKSAHSAVNMLGYIATALATIWLSVYRYQKFTGQGFKLKLNSFPVLPMMVSILMILTMPIIADPVSIIFPMPESVKKMFEAMSDNSVYSYLMIVIAAPILEETVFRGIILNGLLKRYSPNIAIVVSAGLFAFIHLNPWQAIPAFLGALIMGWMYWKTNSIIPGIILHFVNNLFASTLEFLFKNLKNVDNLQQLFSLPVYIGIYLFCIAVLMGGWYYLETYFENHEIEDDEWEAEISGSDNDE